MRRLASSAARSAGACQAPRRPLCVVTPPLEPPRSLNKALAHLIRSGRLCEARRLFDSLPGHHNVVTWNSMIGGYVRHRELSEARRLFDEMPARDVVSWNSILAGYALSSDLGELEEARRIFDRIPARDIVSWNTMITGYARNGRMGEAMHLFGRMPDANVVTWNSVINGFLGVGDVKRAVELFDRMPVRNSASLNSLVSGFIRNNRLEEAEEWLLGNRRKVAEIDGLIDSYNTLIAGYAQRGRVNEARRLFDSIPCSKVVGDTTMSHEGVRFERNIVSWNSMIMGYAKTNDLPAARILFDEMPKRDLISWNTMIAAYVRHSSMEKAKALFEEMFNPDAWTWNSMICGFTQTGQVDRAREFFDRMPQKSIVSWNTMIAGYEQNGDYHAAFWLFASMCAAGERPDRHTLSSVLSASAGLAMLLLGLQVHQLITKTIRPDIPINNALVTMYSRCGNLMHAKTIFDGMGKERDVISWNAMIAGYAQHGQAREALEHFERMKLMSIKPTHITFISVLNACGHSGLVNEGRRQFDSMARDFGIIPRVEHYASLVDLIGRYGQLEDAMEVIHNMTVKPDKAVWGALLGACRVHNNVALARVAAEALVEIEPESSAPYVLLHNMHADEGKWSNATEIRKLMDKNMVVKQPGYSWIELHNKVHIFISGDRSHPFSHEIFSLLESFSKTITDLQVD
ncbi:pentatricopeptide repeat-containing protein At1g62260, mitochondrial-like [Zingiber officinale]|uniref:pentatricopeptide repeat-containing protein At1g62260, mitochondrial-like n=1 Tax=Zingiber officinale TaxID=94328 RepID=UPI001C4B8F49|nr:pentatricopeptide repeat-containing protein At1g62260, mitochondrial-like [Zingiber officinale]